MMLDIIGTALSIAGIFLNAKKIIWCWHVWIASNVFWIAYCIKTNQIPALIMWIVFFFANLYGYFQWKMNR
jgi:nicotinamide riboside transporter PnuC